jgi:hypothetical protein
MERAISRVIVIAQDDNRVGMFCGFLEHPHLARKTHDWMAKDEEKREKSEENQKEEEAEKDAAALRPPQDFVSSERSRSAASSGRSPLK